MAGAEFVRWLTGPNGAAANPFYSGTDLGIVAEILNDTQASQGKVIEGVDTYPYVAFGDTNGPAPSYTKITDNMFGQLFPPDPGTGTTYLQRIGLTVGAEGSGDAYNINLRSKLNTQTQPIPRDLTPGESSCIPTSMKSIERAPYVGMQTVICSYMSVVQFDGAGLWRTNYGGFAYSQDLCVTWAKPARSKWYNTEKWDDPWQMATIARKNQFDRYLYVLGTPNGRFGGVKISRVEQHRILDVSAYPNPYTYWDGASWSQDRSKAVDIVPAPVGEIGIMWHQATNQWLMGYLNENKYALVLRKAPNVWGPWSAEEIIVTGAQYPQLYGCFFWDRTSFNPTPYFNMSQFGEYNVRLMRLIL